MMVCPVLLVHLYVPLILLYHPTPIHFVTYNNLQPLITCRQSDGLIRHKLLTNLFCSVTRGLLVLLELPASQDPQEPRFVHISIFINQCFDVGDHTC